MYLLWFTSQELSIYLHLQDRKKHLQDNTDTDNMLDKDSKLNNYEDT